MEGSGSNNVSVSEDLSIYSESSADPPDPSGGHGGQLSVDDLGICLCDSLKIQCDQKSKCGSISSPGKNKAICLVKEDESNDGHGIKIGNPLPNKCLDKSATFPCSSKAVSSVGLVDVEKQLEDEQTSEVSAQSGLANFANQPCLRSSVSLPTPLKLVPAIKGSREKLGNPTTKLTVKWAPDVYDPPPSAASHVPTNKPKRHRSDGKKNGKNKQKGSAKSTHGGKGKDKKQTRKHGGSSSRCYKSLGDDDREVSSSEPPLAGIVDFDVGSADAFCGSSFLKESVTKLHFSTAKAT